MTIRVSNLPLQSTEQDLVNLFAEYGDVQIRFLSDGQVEVNLENQETEEIAIARLNGQEFNGNILSVSAAEEDSRGLKPTSHGTGGQKPKANN
ncbi:RNA-binding protein [Scytonema sp. UIC 10036]|uniref:RNA recognition motif domain-containing protein n=1 Tax=Scytonema sp. UIC 10036 TaxID=2304196 RepID=UPI0012DAA0BD|nr:RNA-binding protein [Scytonema sp. UIC 10036]MUG91165.1 RNA-binding protein [Scytonema sp. UIC 10036]